MSVDRRFGSTFTPLVSVITPTIPERIRMLDQLRITLMEQTLTRWEHIVVADPGFRGCAVTVNEAASVALTGWLFLIADDDLLEPACLEQHYKARVGADIVYGPPIVEGEPDAQFHGEPPGIPSTALIRRKTWESLGGYDVKLGQCEDCDLYQRALDAGVVFRRIDEPLWRYRFHGKNKSRGATWKAA